MIRVMSFYAEMLGERNISNTQEKHGRKYTKRMRKQKGGRKKQEVKKKTQQQRNRRRRRIRDTRHQASFISWARGRGTRALSAHTILSLSLSWLFGVALGKIRSLYTTTLEGQEYKGRARREQKRERGDLFVRSIVEHGSAIRGEPHRSSSITRASQIYKYTC